MKTKNSTAKTVNHNPQSRGLRTLCAVILLALLALTPQMTATELLLNRSFDEYGTNWIVNTNVADPANVFSTLGEANLHGKSGIFGTLLWQDLDVTGGGGAAASASITLHKVSAPSGNTIAVYLEYTVASGATNRLLLLNPNNADVMTTSTTFSTSFTVPSEAQRLVRYAVDKTISGEFHAEEFSLDLGGTVVPFTYTTNSDNTLNITGYTGAAGIVSIPDTINGLPVASIGTNAFQYRSSLFNVMMGSNVTRICSGAFSTCTGLTNITMGNGVTSIEDNAFFFCSSLTGIAIPNSVQNIGPAAFYYCTGLTNVTLGSGVTNIGASAFNNCTSLNSVIIPGSVTSIGSSAFSYCSNLRNISIPASVINLDDYTFNYCTGLRNVTIPINVTNIGNYAFAYSTNLLGVYFIGNAPAYGSQVFRKDTNAIVYYLPGTTGWGATFAGCPAVLWDPQLQTSGPTFGVHNNQFGFTIASTNNLVIVVEYCTNLANPIWNPLVTNTIAGGLLSFTDSQWTNSPVRLYRFRSP